MAGPSYITALRNAVEQNRAAYCTPPPTGGKQMSVRLDDFRLNHVEAVAELAKWNRSEVLYAIAHYEIQGAARRRTRRRAMTRDH